jgi:proteasome accessory factor C
MSYGARAQVPRMLAMVPYLRERAEVPVDQVARDFGVSRAQVVKDLGVLWFCGLPEAVTGEMIDVDMDALESDGVVRIDNAEFLPRPLRLTVAEALSLIVALRTLREATGSRDRDAVERALAKLESAAGDGAAAASNVSVLLEPADRGVTDAVTAALDSRRRLHIAYLVASRDEQTERDVDPLRLITEGGHSYLEAWCHRVDDVRLFRLDRLVEASVLEIAADDHTGLPRRDVSAGVYSPAPDDLLAVLDVSPEASWVTELMPVDSSTDLPDGIQRVAVRVGDPAWLRRLVLRAGGSVRVVEPVTLAREVAAHASSALAAYS